MNKYKVLIIDGDHLMYRCLYQSGLRKLSHNYEGTRIPTGIIKGVLSSLTGYIKKFTPDTVYFCISGGACLFRKELYPEYKSRKKDDSFTTINESAGEEFSSDQMLLIQRQILSKILPDFGIRVISAPGFEADDCGLYSGYMYLRDPENYEVTLISDDWDWAQIVYYGGSLYRSLKDEIVFSQNFKEKTGVSPEAFVYFKALKGDSSDGIPSVVRGLGEKTAIKLLNGMEEDKIDLNLENILDYCQNYISESKSERLKEAREDFVRNMLLISMTNKTMLEITPYLKGIWSNSVSFDYQKARLHIQNLSLNSVNDILVDPLMLNLK